MSFIGSAALAVPHAQDTRWQGVNISLFTILLSWLILTPDVSTIEIHWLNLVCFRRSSMRLDNGSNLCVVAAIFRVHNQSHNQTASTQSRCQGPCDPSNSSCCPVVRRFMLALILHYTSILYTSIRQFCTNSNSAPDASSRLETFHTPTIFQTVALRLFFTWSIISPANF